MHATNKFALRRFSVEFISNSLYSGLEIKKDVPFKIFVSLWESNMDRRKIQQHEDLFAELVCKFFNVSKSC